MAFHQNERVLEELSVCCCAMTGAIHVMAFMRQSKFRHVFGKAIRREQCYDNIKVTRTAWDSTYCSVNPKFIAIITEAAGGGSFLVLPIGKVGRIERDVPLVCGHKAAVLDIQWCPFNDDIIASASEDCTVKIWQIPENGVLENITEPLVDLVAHQRRVGLVVWHPTAYNILLSAGSDNKIFIWDVGCGEPVLEITLPDIVFSASWSYNGSKLVTTCKDKTLRVFNPRTGDTIAEGKCHAGSKPSQAVYMKDDKIFTTGFSRMSERQYALWNDNEFSEPISMEEIDNNNAVLFPFYDADTNMIYLCGKGDSLIRYYEVTDESPYVHFLNLFQSKDPQRGVGFMPKRGLNVNNCEIARIYKLQTANQGLCEVIPFTVPRKSELFQEDLYPDTAADIPAISAEEWLGGKNATPVLVSLKGGSKESKKKEMKVLRKSNILDKMPSRASAVQQSNDVPHEAAGSSAAALPPTLPPDFQPDEVLAEIKSLKDLVKSQDKRIVELEKRFEQLENSREVHTDEEEVNDA